MSAEPRYLLTTLTTVYNAERFMRGHLEDLAAQTILDRMQIVIVDSASPTNEGAMVEEFARGRDNVVYVRTPEREGILAAMNRALALAEGRYVTPASADDRHRADAFARLVEVLEADPGLGLAYGDQAITAHENETLASAYARGRVTGHFRWPAFDPRLLFQVCCVGPQPVWRRDLHARVGVFDPAYVTAGDYDLYLRFAAAGVRFAHVAEVLGLYLLSPTGNEHANLELSAVESEQARIRHWPPAWGERPRPGGCFVEPLAPGTVMAAPVPSPASVPAAEAPLVSVIVPTRNRPDWLRRALESVLAQTHPRVEVVVVNDGGDDVGAVLAPLRARGEIVAVHLPERRERSAARNAGLALARGTYVAYLDDDDWYHPDHLATLVRALEADGAAVAYSDAQRVHEQPLGTTYVATGLDVPYSVDFDRALLLTGNYIPICCVLHRRDCLARVGGFDETLATHEDWDLLIRLSRVWDFVHVRAVTCGFSWRTDGTSTTSARPDDFRRTAALVHARHAGAADPAESAPSSGLVRREGEGPYAVSIIVPVLDRVELTTQCLAALVETTREISFEVVIVDNGSTDGTAELLARLGGDLQVIRNPENLGFARACNQGARAARGRHLIFLSNDTIPLPGWLPPLVEEVEADPAVAAVGARLLFPDGSIQHAGVAFSRLTGTPYHIYQRLPGDAPEANRRRELQAVTAACVLVRRDAFEALGGFDEAFLDCFADVDLCLRLGLRGGRLVYQPRSVLVHREGQSAGRHDHDAADARLLAARWGHRLLVDEDVVYDRDGWRLRSHVADGRVRLELARAGELPDAAAWEHLVEAERRALVGDLDGLRARLADADAWPRDVVALEWAAALCARAGCPERAADYLRRVLALAERPDVRVRLERLAAGAAHESA